MRGAPVAVSGDLQQYTKFSTSRSGTGIVLHTCVAIAELNRISTSAQGGVLNGTNELMSMQLNLTQPAGLSNAGTKINTTYVSPVFDLIASAFVKYRVKKLIFHYEPQSAATADQRLVFAFAADPMHPLLWNSTVPTQSKLLALSDSIAFAPWRNWSMDVTGRMNGQEFYTFSEPTITVASFAERFSDFGVISCLTSSVSGTVTSCGVLYMESEIELLEFCPISVTLPASKHLATRFAPSLSEENTQEYGVPSAASSSERVESKKIQINDLSETQMIGPQVSRRIKTEQRRLCEEAVRKFETTSPRLYAFFRKNWKDDIENRPEELLKELEQELLSL
jgi:hypothetical protein